MIPIIIPVPIYNTETITERRPSVIEIKICPYCKGTMNNWATNYDPNSTDFPCRCNRLAQIANEQKVNK